MEESKDSTEDNEYMKVAIELAKTALKEDEVPVACLFVYKPTGEIIAKAHNMTNATKCVRCL